MARRGLSRGNAMDDGFTDAMEMPSLSLVKGVGVKDDNKFKKNNNIVITPIRLDNKNSPRIGGGGGGMGNNLVPPSPRGRRGNDNFPNPTAQFGNQNSNFNNDNMGQNNYGGPPQLDLNHNYNQTPQFQGNHNQMNQMGNNYNGQQHLDNFTNQYNNQQMMGGQYGNNNNNLQINVGGFGQGNLNNNNRLGGGNQGYGLNQGNMTSDQVLNAISQHIQGFFQQRKIQSIAEYFAPYDVYENRQFEAWEFAIMFMNIISPEDAKRFVDQNGINMGMGQRVLTYTQLISQLQTRVQMSPGNVGRVSVYQSKPQTQQIQNYLNQIQRIFSQSGRPFDMAYDMYFNQSHINQNEFQQFLNRVQINVPQHELYQLFGFFLIQNENMISKICFIQALKQLQNGGIGGNYNNPYDNVQNPNRNNIPYDGRVSPAMTTIVSAASFDSIQTSMFGNNEHPLMQKVISAARNHMLNNRNQTFEGMMSQFNIQLTREIDNSKFEELCLRLKLTFSPLEMNTLTSILDQGKRGYIQLATLRQKIESNQSQNITPMASNTHSGLGMYPNNQGGQYGQNNNNFGQSFGQNNPPPLHLDNPISFGPALHNNPGYGQGQGQGGFNNNHYNNIDTKPLLEKIRQYLQQTGFANNLYRLFSVSFLNGKEVAELQEFLNFLQSPGLGMTQYQAYQIAQDCQMLMSSRRNYQTQLYIDLSKFEELLFKDNQMYLQQYKSHHNSMQTLSKIYESIRRYIMITGGNIQKFFSEADVNKDNFISKAELKLALEKIGHYGITDDEINQIYLIFDQNQDGRISYAELCQQFAEFSNTKAIKDPSHWSFFIFEIIRRACHSTQRPIADLFGLQGLNVQNLQQKCYISKAQFFGGLEKLQIKLYIDQEQKLLELLDADAAHQHQIDFIHFCQLVGLHHSPSQIQQINNDYARNPMALLVRQKTKKFYRTLIGVMESRRISIPNLQMMLRGSDVGNFGIISFDEFVKILSDIDFERRIDFNDAREVCNKYISQSNGYGAEKINYKDFLQNLVYQNEKYQVINLIFLTLQNEMKRLSLTNLYDVFKAYDRSNGLRQFDKDMLIQTLRAIGVQLTDYDIGMIIIEYDPDGRDGRLDFPTFESDFMKYQQGQSELNFFVKRPNMQYNGFNDFINRQPPGLNLQQPGNLGGNPNNIRVPNGLVIRLQEKVAKFLDSEMTYKIHQALLNRGINKLGTLKSFEFQEWLQHDMYFTRDDAINLYNHYDPMNRGEMKIAEFLVDIKDKILNMSVRLSITELAQQYSFQLNNDLGYNSGNNLQRFAKDFEEIYKAIRIRNMDTFSYFNNMARGSDRINRDLFRQALFTLELKHLQQNVIDSIFDSLDTNNQQVIQVYSIDEAIRKSCNLDENKMQDDIMEKIVMAFNGDDGFLLTQLMEYDRTRRGLVDIMSFTDFIVKNSPHHQQLNEIDVRFLGMKYTNPRSANPNAIDINTFLSDFSRLRSLKGLQRGDYSGLHNIQQQNQFGKNFNMDNYDNFGSGHRNPYLPQTSRTNTRAEINRTNKPYNFNMNLDSHYLEEIAKGTYLQDKLVENYFKQYAQTSNNGILSEADFAIAIQRLNLSWVANSTNSVYQQIDYAFHNNQQRRMITPEEIDQAICFGAKKSIDDMQQEILIAIAKQAAQRGINMRQQIVDLDHSSSKQIRLDQLKRIILDEIRAPNVMDIDVDFICKRYIQNIPSVIPYERFLDDFESITKSQFHNVGSSAMICEYIKKGVIVQKSEMIEFFQKFMRKRDMLTITDIQSACSALGLIPSICDNKQIENLYYDVDNSGSKEIPLSRFVEYVIKTAYRQTREMQDAILDEIVSKIQGKNTIAENLFKKDDQMNKGYVADHVFYTILGRSLKVKDIDAKLLGMRYQERQEFINYTKFLHDVKMRANTTKGNQFGTGNQFGNVQVGLNNNNATGNDYQQNKLKELLIQISQYVQQTGISLTQPLSQLEKGFATGTVPYTQFLQVLNNNLRLPSQDVTFIADIYTLQQVQQTNSYQFNNKEVDYRKFLADLKMQQSSLPNRLQASLTDEQRKFYKQMANHMKSKNRTNLLFDSFLEKDYSHKYYLPKATIEEVLKKNDYTFSNSQMKIFLGALDTNSHGEYSYKNIFELLIGEEDAQKLFTGGLVGSGTAGRGIQSTNFYMPSQPIGAANPQMDSIGRKLISSNINYEEEIRKRIGSQQANSNQPKANEPEILDVLKSCNVFLSPDERTALVSYFQSKQDYTMLVPVLDFLQAVGLPAQTLGSRGQKQLPRKILNPQELKTAQDIVARIRDELQRMGKQPKDIFEMFKSNQSDLTMPVMKFKLALAQIGQIGRVITDDQITLLQYYLSQEVPNEISFKKMYLAFTLSDRDPPLKQQGADEIQQYQKKLTERLEKGIPIEILDLSHFMRDNNTNLQLILKNKMPKDLMPRQEFETALKEAGYVAGDLQKLIQLLDVRGTMQSVSIMKLQAYLQKAAPALANRQITKQEARDRYQGFDPKIRHYLQKISEYMKRMNISVTKMFNAIDIDQSGTVDKQEFVTKLSYLDIPGVQMQDIGMIFDAIDINNDGQLTINEFSMFMEGANVTRQQRSQEIDPKIIEEMKQQIDQLFHQFDDNGDGYVTPEEIQKAMIGLGQRISLEDAKLMIASIDANGDGRLDQREFLDLMLPKMKEELLSSEESLEDLRAMFLDADIDHSGTLSIDEIYSVMLKLGAKVEQSELIELMNEIDVDRDGTVDIDEFIALMSLGDDMQFRSAQAKSTFMNIKKARKLGAMDFFKSFKNLPQSFVPSFFTEKWVKSKKNLPSSVFMPQIDKSTMLYKDLYPVLKENLTENMNQLAFQPRVRPLYTQLGVQITLDEAQGVPMPASGNGFDAKTQIVKRMVRIGLFDTIKKDFIYNAVQVNALYNQVDEDIWKFNAQKDAGTNPVLFKAANKDDVQKPNIFMIFELVIAVKSGDKVSEISCGWCQLELEKLDRVMTHKLQIKGGSPNAEMLIKDADVHTNRTGMKYIMKVMQSKIQSQLTVSIRTFNKFTDESKLHVNLLPSCCFIQKRLLYFVSGFRNYLGEKLLRESAMTYFRQPEGDVIISCFPKILDNPDICEQIIQIWSENVWAGLNERSKQNIELIMLRTKEFIQKLYPVLYAEEFKFNTKDYTMSAAGDQYLLRKREELIVAALCYNNPQSKIKATKALESMTTFKPFTVRELDFEVWDTKAANIDRYMRQYEEIGLLGGGGPHHQHPGTYGGNQMNLNLNQVPSVLTKINQNQKAAVLGGSLHNQPLQISNNIHINQDLAGGYRNPNLLMNSNNNNMMMGNGAFDNSNGFNQYNNDPYMAGTGNNFMNNNMMGGNDMMMGNAGPLTLEQKLNRQFQ